jgi:hypothetical protein
VAQFEQYLAERDIDVSFDTLSQLYTDPNNLDVLPNDKLKLLVCVVCWVVLHACSAWLTS